MYPDAIIIFSAGAIQFDKNSRLGWRSTTYEDSDSFGALGGRDRVEAAAILARQYPSAFIVSTSRRITGETVTLAEIYAQELRELGVCPTKIMEEKESINAFTQVKEALRIAQEKNWRNLLFLSSGYQLPRLEAFYRHSIIKNISVKFIASEMLLSDSDPSFKQRFAHIQTMPSYQMRLESERQGLLAIESGRYLSASAKEKLEKSSSINY